MIVGVMVVVLVIVSTDDNHHHHRHWRVGALYVPPTQQGREKYAV